MNNETNNGLTGMNPNNLTPNSEPVVNEIPNQIVENTVDNTVNNNLETPPVELTTDNTLLEDNINGGKKKNNMPLILIAILVVILVGVGIYFFFFRGINKNLSSKDVYYSAIDNVGNYLNNSFNNINITKNKTTHKITASIDSEDEIFNNIEKLVQQLELNLEIESDLDNKLLVAGINANYSNSNILNLKGVISNNDAYIGLGNLYDKYIKVSTSELNTLWDVNNSVDSKESISKFINALKSNLKEEYFTKESVKLNNEDVTKYNLTINNLQEFCTNVLNTLHNSDNSSDTNIADSIKDIISDSQKLIIETYINKKNEVLKINIKFDDKNNIDINKEGSKYIVNYNADSVTIKLAEVEITKDSLTINSAIEEVTINVIIDNKNKNYEFKVNLACEESAEECTPSDLNIKLTGDNNKGNLNVTANIEGIQFTINDNYESNNNVSFNKDDLNNNINYQDFNEEEQQKVMDNISKNEKLMEFLGTLGLDFSNELDTDEMLEVACMSTVDGVYNENVDNLFIECRNGFCRITDTNDQTILGTKNCSE